MTTNAQANLAQRLQRLETHLAQEHPILLDVVKSFRKLDKLAYRMGLLSPGESYTTRVPWWPLISVLGTFSSGKSTFINDYLSYKLQLTGNQAVDDRFTVICYSNDATHRVLPGLALDSDPRFPFYHISREIDTVARGEGRRVDAYLQLKTCPSEALRGKILIDSPGFDADLQRTSTLRITNHIIDLSDLVLVFFDARHPEPGVMKDTLQHLVADTIIRPDSSKFLYVLNQIDVTAREDNPEEVFAAWQRALASVGLTAGRFYRIYNLEAANPIDDENLRRRFEAKRAADMSEVLGRIQQVEVERCYRIIGVLEKTAKAIRDDYVPRLIAARQKWKQRVRWIDALVYVPVVAGVAGWSIVEGWWEADAVLPPWLVSIPDLAKLAVALVAAALLIYPHFLVRRLAAKGVVNGLRREPLPQEVKDILVRAFEWNAEGIGPLLRRGPAGWGRRAQKTLLRVLSDADRYVEALNDRFANPSGDGRGTGNVEETFAAPEIAAGGLPAIGDQPLAEEGIRGVIEIPNVSRVARPKAFGRGPGGSANEGSGSRDEQRPRPRRVIHFEEPPPARGKD